MLIKINLIFEGVFCIVTYVLTSKNILFKHVTHEKTVTQKHAQTHFKVRRLIHVMVQALVQKSICTASNTLVSALRCSGAKI